MYWNGIGLPYTEDISGGPLCWVHRSTGSRLPEPELRFPPPHLQINGDLCPRIGPALLPRPKKKKKTFWLHFAQNLLWISSVGTLKYLTDTHADVTIKMPNFHNFLTDFLCIRTKQSLLTPLILSLPCFLKNWYIHFPLLGTCLVLYAILSIFNFPLSFLFS